MNNMSSKTWKTWYQMKVYLLEFSNVTLFPLRSRVRARIIEKFISVKGIQVYKSYHGLTLPYSEYVKMTILIPPYHTRDTSRSFHGQIMKNNGLANQLLEYFRISRRRKPIVDDEVSNEVRSFFNLPCIVNFYCPKLITPFL